MGASLQNRELRASLRQSGRELFQHSYRDLKVAPAQLITPTTANPALTAIPASTPTLQNRECWGPR
jgi:hypothetical protein